MKNLILFLLFSNVFLFLSCQNKTTNNQQQRLSENSNQEENRDELAIIEQNGKSFYEWYFKNEFPNMNVIKDKNGKCKLDTLSYFKELRKLGTISEKFINKEKERTHVCSEFISTIDYSEYEEVDAYEYDKYCIDFYYYNWLKSQEHPNNFSVKNIKKINDNKASLDIYVNYGGDDSPLSTVFLEKEQGIWKIVEIKFIHQEETKPEKAKIYGKKWYGGIVALNIGETSLAYEYHGQCVYFYPVKKISDTEFEMIWARDVDCKFDNGTSETFGLADVPKIGKPFAKYTLKDNILYATYYYREWVKSYSQQVAKDVFVDRYFLNDENN